MRQLRRNPSFAITSILIVALGIASSVSIFAFVDAALIKPLPYKDPNRLVHLYESIPLGPRFHLSYPDYQDLSARNDVFDGLVAYSPMFGALNLGDRSRLALGEIVTGNYFRMLGVSAAAGRTLLPEDDAPGPHRPPRPRRRQPVLSWDPHRPSRRVAVVGVRVRTRRGQHDRGGLRGVRP